MFILEDSALHVLPHHSVPMLLIVWIVCNEVKSKGVEVDVTNVGLVCLSFMPVPGVCVSQTINVVFWKL